MNAEEKAIYARGVEEGLDRGIKIARWHVTKNSDVMAKAVEDVQKGLAGSAMQVAIDIVDEIERKKSRRKK